MERKPSVSYFRTLNNDLPELKRYLSRGIKVLDVGCGIGTIAFDVAKYVYPGEVIGIDPNGEEISEATEWTKEAKFGVSIQFKTGDVHKLDFPDNTFDLVYSHTVTHFLIDPVLALKEQHRVVKPGGWVIASGVRDFNLANRFPPCPNLDVAWMAMGAYWDGVSRRYQLGGDDPSEFMSQERAKMPSYLAYFDMHSGLKSLGWFIEAGLKNFDISVKADFIRSSNPDGPGPWWTNMLPTARDEDFDEDDDENFPGFQRTYNLIYGELIRQDAIDWNTIEDAREEVLAWYKDPRAFSFCTLVFVAGQA